jgi:hypothetical protein
MTSVPVGVVVLGMGRSGTSAVSGMFVRCGFFAGRDGDVLPPNESNPAGHHENLGIMHANERLLSRLGGDWFDPPPETTQLRARSWAMPLLRAELERVIRDAQGAPVVIKDPRIGVMMPLWEPILADRLHPLIVIRNPVEVARSIWQRDGTPIHCGLGAWELHMTGLLRCLDGRDVTIARYAALLQDRRLGSRLVGSIAALMEPIAGDFVRPDEASDALDVGLRHHRAVMADNDEMLTTRQREVWTYLSSMACGEHRLDAPPALRAASTAAQAAIQAETDRRANAHWHDRIAGELAAVTARTAVLEKELSRARSQVADLAAEVAAQRERANVSLAAQRDAEQRARDLQASASWRLTAPLRILKRALPPRKRPRRELSHAG